MDASGPSDECKGHDGGVLPLELRVHGVGNPPDDTVLPPPGVETDTDVRLVRWGHLVAGKKLFPLWVLLAPFTLANVAGWMHPANAPRRSVWCRRIVHVIGISLTVTTTAWVAQLIVDVGAWQGLVALGVWERHPIWRLTLGLVLTLIAVVAAFNLAGRTREAAEAVAPYTAAPEARGGIDDDERIYNPAFFAHEPDLAFLTIVHQLAALGTVAIMGVLAFQRAETTAVVGRPGALRLGDVFVTVGGIQWIGVAALAVAGMEHPRLWHQRWRYSGPAVAMGLAVLLSNAGWSGAALALRLLSGVTGSEVVLGSEVALLEGFTWGVGAALLTAAVIAVIAAVGRVRADDPTAGPGVPRPLLVLRSLVRGIDLIVTAGVIVAFAVGSVQFLDRFRPPNGLIDLWPVQIVAPSSGGLSWLYAAVPLVLVIAAGAAAVATRHVPRMRPWVASAWEVLTFWPRRFHPLAVTPYSEVIVPQLQLAVVDGLKSGSQVVISAHSQGSVLAVSALAGLAGGGVNLAGTSLVTHACPLGPLYGRFFPHQFAPEALVPLSRHLAVEQGAGSAWFNAWRPGDPVGGPIERSRGNSATSGPVELRLSGVGHTAAFDDPEVRRAIDVLIVITAIPQPDQVIPPLDRVSFSPKPMVGWFDPSVLFLAGSSLALTDAVGPFADRRESLGVSGSAGGVIELAEFGPESTPGQPVWIDYVADIGDGQVPTMAVAWHLARGLIRRENGAKPDEQPSPERAVELAHEQHWDHPVALTPRPTPDGDDVALPRGSLLVIGGDLAYPIGTTKAYENRVIGPYQQASDGPEVSAGTPPVVVAIPGNHDWYDGLNGFAGLMCQQAKLGVWQTVQQRSYVAVALAPGWMLWAVDGGPTGSDVNPSQLAYFRAIGRDLAPEVSVILAWPTPAWASGHRHVQAQVALDRFVLDTLGDPDRVALYLSGDSHHYAHFCDESSGVHYVTAGGGGAFTHPTHSLQRRRTLQLNRPGEVDETTFALTDASGRFGRRTLRLRSVFPSFAASKRALWRHVRFPFINSGFLLVTGTLNAMFALIAVVVFGGDRALLAVLRDLGDFRLAEYWANPVTWGPALIVLAGTTVFARAERADRASKFTARIAGLAHGVVQLFVIGIVLALSARAGTWAGDLFNDGPRNPASVLGITIAAPSLVAGVFAIVVATVVGSVVSAWVLAGYLVVTNLRLGMHDNEAFSALRLTTYKNFLRIRIEPDGDLTVYPVGLERTKLPRRSSAPPEGVGIDAHPAVFATDPKLIEAPFTVRHRSGLSDPTRPVPPQPDRRAAPDAEASRSGPHRRAAAAASPLRPPARRVRSAPPPVHPSDPPPSSGPSSTGDDPAPPR